MLTTGFAVFAAAFLFWLWRDSKKHIPYGGEER
jgi:hypothetical protein